MIFLGFFLSVTRIPMNLVRWVGELDAPPYLVIAVIFAVYFVLGALMEEIAILVIMTPIVYPIVLSFVTSAVTKVPIAVVYRGVTPFWLALIVAGALLIAFPEIATFLPGLMR